MSRSMLLKYLDNRIYARDLLNLMDQKYNTIIDIKITLNNILSLLEQSKVVEAFVSMKTLDLRYVEPLSRTELICMYNVSECLKNNNYTEAYEQFYLCIDNCEEGQESDRFINVNEYYMIKFLVKIFIREISDKFDSTIIREDLKVI